MHTPIYSKCISRVWNPAISVNALWTQLHQLCCTVSPVGILKFMQAWFCDSDLQSLILNLLDWVFWPIIAGGIQQWTWMGQLPTCGNFWGKMGWEEYWRFGLCPAYMLLSSLFAMACLRPCYNSLCLEKNTLALFHQQGITQSTRSNPLHELPKLLRLQLWMQMDLPPPWHSWECF